MILLIDKGEKVTTRFYTSEAFLLLWDYYDTNYFVQTNNFQFFVTEITLRMEPEFHYFTSLFNLHEKETYIFINDFPL